MDWRTCFARYLAALTAHERAQDCLDQLQARLSPYLTGDEHKAIDAGVAVARRRVRLTGETLAAATDTLTQGRSVLEAMWVAPDDV